MATVSDRGTPKLTIASLRKPISHSKNNLFACLPLPLQSQKIAQLQIEIRLMFFLSMHVLFHCQANDLIF